jgi:hypothetical protein
MSPVIFQIARGHSSKWPIVHRYENHRAYCEMILTTPLSRVDRAVERYFDKLYSPFLNAKVQIGDERGGRSAVPIHLPR